MQKIPYFSGRTKLNHFNSTMSASACELGLPAGEEEEAERA